MTIVERFARLFSGRESVHGRFTGGVNGTPKKAVTVKKGATLENYADHLKGSGAGLGIAPIRLDNTCIFGAIDLDDDHANHAALDEAVRKLNLPLVVVRSKSGGAHLYLFLPKPEPASLVKHRLTNYQKQLQLQNPPDTTGKRQPVEIFPKQKTLQQHEYGNWINLPYYGGDASNRFAFACGKRLTLDEFLDYAEGRYAQCLVGEGGRNIDLFNHGCILRDSGLNDTDELYATLRSYSDSQHDPPLPDSEINTVTRSVLSRDRPKKSSAHTREMVVICAADIKPERVDWLHYPHIAFGIITLLVGMPGLGKTLYAVYLAARASRGELTCPEPVNVLYLSAEDMLAQTLVPRLHAAKADMSRIHFGTMQSVGFQEPVALSDDIEALSAQIQLHSIRLLIVDPLMAHLPSNVDSYRDQDVRRALGPLAKVVEMSHCAVLIIAHLNKTPTTDLFARVGGSIGITAAPRSVLLLAPDSDNPQDNSARCLVHGKTNLGVLAVTQRLRVKSAEVPSDEGLISTAVIEVTGEAAHIDAANALALPEKKGRREEAEEFLETMLRNGPQPAKEVVAKAIARGISEKTIFRAKERLGLVVKRVGFGKGSRSDWELPPQHF